MMTGIRITAWCVAVAWLAGVAALLAPAARAAELEGAALIEALRKGGYNIYFRHAATAWDQDDQVEGQGDWTSCDPTKMRQLSAEGQEMAAYIGEALRALQVPVAKVLTSEYCRARQTGELMDIGPVTTTRDIMNLRAADHVGGDPAAIARAREVLAQLPPEGANVVIVGHGNLMRAATGAYAEEGGSAVFAPRTGVDPAFEVVARLSVEEWQRLANLPLEAPMPSPKR